jgi:hypothetical protein
MVKLVPDVYQLIVGGEIQRIHFVGTVDGDQSHWAVFVIGNISHV